MFVQLYNVLFVVLSAVSRQQDIGIIAHLMLVAYISFQIAGLVINLLDTG